MCLNGYCHFGCCCPPKPRYCSGSGKYVGTRCCCSPLIIEWNSTLTCCHHKQSNGYVYCPDCYQYVWAANGVISAHYPKYTLVAPEVHVHLTPAPLKRPLTKKRSSRW